MAWQNAHPELYDEQADQFIKPVRLNQLRENSHAP
jgi:hypothetical protein